MSAWYERTDGQDPRPAMRPRHKYINWNIFSQTCNFTCNHYTEPELGGNRYCKRYA